MRIVPFALILLVVAGVYVIFSAPRDKPWTESHTKRMRGRDAYYSEAEISLKSEPIAVRLKGDPEVYLKLGFVYTVKLGRELLAEGLDAKVAEMRPKLVDRFYSELGHLTLAQMESIEGKLNLKDQLRQITQEVLFPEDLARVENIYYDPFLLQFTNVGLER